MGEVNIDAWLEIVRLTKSPGTYREYYETMQMYRRYLRGDVPNPDNAQAFILNMVKLGKAPSTVSRNASAVRRLFRQAGILLPIETPVVSRKLPTWLEPNEIPIFLDAAKDYSLYVRKAAYYLPAALTVVACGLRSKELLGLTCKDVERMGYLTVIRKRGRQDRVVVSPEDFKSIWNWTSKMGNLLAHPDAPVFEGITHRVFYNDTVTVGQMSGLKKHITPHVLRHTCGTSMAYAGKTIEEIASQLGDTLEVVRVYIHIAADFRQRKLPSIMERIATWRQANAE